MSTSCRGKTELSEKTWDRAAQASPGRPETGRPWQPGTVQAGVSGASRSAMKGAAINADLIAARKERNAAATEWQGVHGNATSTVIQPEARWAQLGPCQVLSSKRCTQRASCGQSSRNSRMQTLRRFPSQQRGEPKREANALPTGATKPSAQNFADALGLPRMIHCRQAVRQRRVCEWATSHRGTAVRQGSRHTQGAGSVENANSARAGAETGEGGDPLAGSECDTFSGCVHEQCVRGCSRLIQGVTHVSSTQKRTAQEQGASR